MQCVAPFPHLVVLRWLFPGFDGIFESASLVSANSSGPEVLNVNYIVK